MARWSLVVGCGVLVLAGCSLLAPSDDELLGGGGAGPDAAVGASGGATTGGTTSTGGSGGTVDAGGTSPGGGGASGSSGSGGSAGGSGGSTGAGGASGSAGAGGVSGSGGSAGAAGADGGVDPSVGAIDCATKNECDAATEVCCASGSSNRTCHVGTSSCAGNNVAVHCDGPEDCKNGICCGHLETPTGPYTSFSCTAQCSGYNLTRIICGEGGTCPSPGKCLPSTLLPGYYACGL